MKKLLLALSLSLCLFLGTTLTPSPALAQPVLCCNDGKEFYNGQCHAPVTSDACGVMAQSMCALPPINLVPGCRDQLQDVCLNAYTAGVTVTVHGDDACQQIFGNFSLGGIPVGQLCSAGIFDIADEEVDPNCSDGQTCNSAGYCVSEVSYELCKQIPESESSSRQACESCAQVDQVGNVSGIWTAVGCVSTQPTAMIRTLVQIMISISGGVALLMILAAGFLFSVSQGDPKKVSEAKELMTSAVIGLLFIIFSVVILQFIGLTIFRIPGFGG